MWDGINSTGKGNGKRTPMTRLSNQTVLLDEAGLVLHDGQKNNEFMVQGEEDLLHNGQVSPQQVRERTRIPR